MFVGFCKEEVSGLAPGKYHDHAIGFSVDRSVNCTVFEVDMHSVVFETLNEATGGFPKVLQPIAQEAFSTKALITLIDWLDHVSQTQLPIIVFGPISFCALQKI